jgi:hypothetical protein
MTTLDHLRKLLFACQCRCPGRFGHQPTHDRDCPWVAAKAHVDDQDNRPTVWPFELPIDRRGTEHERRSRKATQ